MKQETKLPIYMMIIAVVLLGICVFFTSGIIQSPILNLIVGLTLTGVAFCGCMYFLASDLVPCKRCIIPKKHRTERICGACVDGATDYKLKKMIKNKRLIYYG